MAKLTAERRRKLPKRDFAGPGRSYPIPDAAHAREALALASYARKLGHLSAASYERIRTKAHKMLRKTSRSFGRR
ncbi:MAG: hypothetical protein ACYDCJ_12995 [Gammaproteobacteria bacterium]